MKILQITPVFCPASAYGGIVGVAYEMSKFLVKRGHEVTVYTTDANIGSRINEEYDNLENINIYYFKNISNTLAWNQRLFVSPGMGSTIKKEIKNFDIVHIHDFRTFQGIVGSHFAKEYEIPYVLQPHGSVTSNINRQYLKKIFNVFFGSRILRDASRILALNRTEADLCRELGVNGDNIEILPNGIDLSKYCHLPREGEFKSKYDIDERIILYVGRIDKSKGLDLLINVFADISKKLENIKLIIVGIDDGYQPVLRDLINNLKISDKVIFTGFISSRDKMSAYVDAEIFVTPSFYGFPLTFLESMACGLPIITTDKGDFISGINNEVGLVVKYNEKDLYDALLKVLTNDELRERFKRNAKRRINYYDWFSLVGKIEELYKSCGETSI